jgi:hemolysin III
LGSPTRPSWRGRLHALALMVMVPLLTVLAVEANGARARVGVLVYAVGVCSMLAVSSTYHRWAHTIRARQIWRRADHATIYAAIAGTFTPICLIVLPSERAVPLLVSIWLGAAVGATMKIMGWRWAAGIANGLYVGLGWAGLLLVPAIWHRFGPEPVVLLFIGGVIYTVGAVFFGRRWPTLRPSVFSYHEVWHAFTLTASGLQLVAVWSIAT